ncbi:insulinase family protein [Halomonas marinisediminis]|uniref:Protease 3 n=1 Tax=Halomonas marinisediminis TaxID=2546095 RepID=A0ABY2D548_9GAMM|nr:insulinase family protein [Halomonas marinisediminis]TDB01265.1 peptidase M16 [Halomonas marinisediminis]
MLPILSVARCGRLLPPLLVLLGLASQSLASQALATQTATAPTEAVEASTTPRVSPHDERDYRVLSLENGFTALLVSDPDADKAAASLNVSVGSAQDPADLSGLAHFLEHMLFLGTEPYPEADAYQGYLTRHGGSHNAFTAPQDTNYFFTIEPDALEGALDRFSQFFIAPLFNADRLESERNVVHSEYMARIRDEGRRVNDVLDRLLNPEHPFTGFSVGSRTTLADRPSDESSLRERVIDFYASHYDANVMHLAIVAPQPLDELERLVAERFATVPDRGLVRPEISDPLVLPETLPRRVAVQSLRDSHQLRFLFPVNDPIAEYRHKPVDLIAHLLGHEGEGSLLAALREAGWADGLSAGVSRGDGRHALFTVDISLTPLGAEHRDAIEESLFAAIETIREAGPEAWRYAEQARLAEQSFQFQQHGSPQQDAMRLAMNLARYQVEDVQYADYRMDGFDRGRTRDYLAALRPDNLIRLYSAPDVEGERTSPWFDTPWGDDAYTADATPRDGLMLPEPNPYIAEDLALLDAQDERPRQRIDEATFTFWHMADASFDTPKVEWRFSLQHPRAAEAPREAVLARLLAGWLEDSLNEVLYPARLAGQGVEAYAHARGITLAFSGWRDRQTVVMERVVEQLQQGAIEADAFERVRHRLQREWRNAPQDPLHRQANRTLAETLVRPQWPTNTLLEASEGMTPGDLREFRDIFLDELHLEAMAVGNIGAEQADEIAQQMADTLAPSLTAAAIPDLVPLAASADLPALTPQTGREESILLRYLQGPDRSLDSQARLALLGQLIDTPFYQRLRTEQQLGYVVHAGYSPMLDAPGLALLVQSPETDSESIADHMDRFLQSFGATLETLDEEALAPYRQAVHAELTRRDTSLSGRTNRLWRTLAYGDTEFERRDKLAERVLAITADELREAWTALLASPEVRVAYDPGDAPTDVLAFTADLEPLPEGKE